MPDQSRRHRHSGRAEFLPVLAVVLLAAILIGVATLWDGGVPDTAIDTAGRETTPSVASDPAGASDQTRPRHDREERVVDGELIEPVEEVAVGEDVQEVRRAAEAGVTKVRQKWASFKIATFNVLAVQHTEPGGQRASWPGAGWRSPQTVGLVRKHGADIVGLQEVKSSQLSAIAGGLGYASWPGGGDPDNSIIYNPAKFEFVSGDTFQVFFMSRNRPQTVLRLRHKQSRREFYVINMHTSAGHGGRYASSRNAAFDTLVAYVNNLKAQKVPIFVTGDMNDRANFYCKVIPRTGLVAAQGGGGTCGSPPRMRPVDWVVATPDVTLTSYWDDFSSEHQRVSDHPFVSASATIEGSGD
ncbi:endonuclease/exonuclease/phosphatase family protein [Nocardioides sp. SYSU DS0651]|uniref:endonuclease/exonuclease/phosphatase family protein n=1 Tax=Nocardioides sp. SYSU DS0651 TaxID=3415955 RepID=UPI003F4CABDA